MSQYEYKIHSHDGSVETVLTSKPHTHHDYAGDIVKWFNDHKKSLAITAASVALIKHGDRVLWKKP